MSEVSLVFVTAGNEKDALAIAEKLVEEKLVACVNVVPQIRSVFLWKGEVCHEPEVLMIMKTPTSLFPSLQKRVKEIHSYEVPEIIAFPVSQGLPQYLQWVVESTEAKG